MIDHLKPLESASQVGLAYIYFERQESQQQSIRLILGCLFKQLAIQNSQVYQYIEDLHEKSYHQREALTATALESALIFAIPHFEKVFLIFDALDHCDEVTTRRLLLMSLAKLQEAGALVMVMSQPHPADIQYSLSEMVKFEVHASEEDIMAYIDDYLRINPLAQRLCGGERKDEIVRKLIGCASGMSVMFQEF